MNSRGNPLLLDEAKSLLLIVDVQERLAPAVEDGDRAIDRCAVLMQGAAAMGVPVVVSEQYPKGLGPTVAPLRDHAPADAIFDKVHFSCAADPDLAAAIADAGRQQVVIAGMEAHVCVLQTALGLAAEGYDVFVVADAVASRRAESVALALDRLRAAGVTVCNAEMVLFEWMHTAGTPEFRTVSRLIR